MSVRAVGIVDAVAEFSVVKNLGNFHGAFWCLFKGALEAETLMC